MRCKPLTCLSMLVLLALPVMAQSAGNVVVPDSSGTIVVDVFAAADPASNVMVGGEARMSKRFTEAALKTANALRTWQRHLAYTIRNGYPPSELWIAQDHDEAALALSMATASASTDAERAAANQLSSIHEHLQVWSDGLLKAYNHMQLAEYYMSPAALQNDPNFQQTAACTETMFDVLQNDQPVDTPLCR